jgi:hypothetical protein
MEFLPQGRLNNQSTQKIINVLSGKKKENAAGIRSIVMPLEVTSGKKADLGQSDDGRHSDELISGCVIVAEGTASPLCRPQMSRPSVRRAAMLALLLHDGP